MRTLMRRLGTLFNVWHTNADLQDYGYGRVSPRV